MTKRIYSADTSDFAKELVGKRITAMANDTLILDDGTVLEIENGGDCCAWFNGRFRKIDFTENAITRVETIDAESDTAPEAWSIIIYSADAQIGAVDIEGDSTSGYYGSSINLLVKRGSDE